MKVKEFNIGTDLENSLNSWIEENKGLIDIIDIKYSVASFTESKSYDSEYFGCALVLYREK